jgi:hypothetical protein
MITGAIEGGIRTLLGSTEPKMTRARKKSYTGLTQSAFINAAFHGTHSDELVHEDRAKGSAGGDIESENTGRSVGCVLDRCEGCRGYSSFDGFEDRAVLVIDEQAGDITTEDLGCDIPAVDTSILSQNG